MITENISIVDWCLDCGHYHYPEATKDKSKRRHCTIEGCRCLDRHFLGRKLKGKFS